MYQLSEILLHLVFSATEGMMYLVNHELAL
jgi:hypothetical protein